MFNFSTKTVPIRQYSLSRLLQLIHADKETREDAKKIQAIKIAYVLNNSTLNFTEQGKVTEIFIFEITLNVKQVPMLFISTLDKTFEQNNIFQLNFGEEKALYCAFKQRTEKGFKIGKYYKTDWAKNPNPITLPVTINTIDGIYTAIIDELIPITATSGEKTEDFVERYDKICKLKREIDKLQKQVDNETQPKKRFELNDELKKLKKELEKILK